MMFLKNNFNYLNETKRFNRFHYSNKSPERRKTPKTKTCPLTFVTFNVGMNNFHLIN